MIGNLVYKVVLVILYFTYFVSFTSTAEQGTSVGSIDNTSWYRIYHKLEYCVAETSRRPWFVKTSDQVKARRISDENRKSATGKRKLFSSSVFTKLN